MKNIILVGPQGSGKGTQARILADLFGYEIFETGAVLRAMAQEDTDLGRKVKEITTRGDLVPNEIVMEIVQDFIEKSESNHIIFDGIPRSEEQRVALEQLLEENEMEFQAVEVGLPIEQCMERLLKRAEIEGRADDNPEAIRNRLKNFFKYTEPLLEHWGERGMLVEVNGDQEVSDVSAELIEKLGLLNEEE